MPPYRAYGSGFAIKVKGLSGRLTATFPFPQTGAPRECNLFDYVDENTVPGEDNFYSYKDIIADKTYTIGIIPSYLSDVSGTDVTILLDGVQVYRVEAVPHFSFEYS